MKKYIVAACLLFVPFMTLAADHCTNPEEYSADKRCYVTDEQKKEKPYNAVVGLVDHQDFIYCTGTIVKGNNGKPYLYTAKHCTDHNNDNVSDKTLKIKLQNGRELDVTKSNTGDYDIKTDTGFDGDWAIYRLNVTDVPIVEKKSKMKLGIGPYHLHYDARAVGYGALKIMSDKDILYFKSKYITYLKDKKGIASDGTEGIYGFRNGGIYAETDKKWANEYVLGFLKDDPNYFWELTGDNKLLKVSSCKYTSTGLAYHCQHWGGDSGGPIFDSKDTIMGIHTRGGRVIGGEEHAGRESWWEGSETNNVDLFK